MDVKGCNVRVQKVDDIHSFRFVLDFIRLCCNCNNIGKNWSYGGLKGLECPCPISDDIHSFRFGLKQVLL